MIDESVKIRIIRILVGMDCKTFAATLGVCVNTVTSWEHGRNEPIRSKRKALAELCQKHGIAFLPSGYPLPKSELMAVLE
jgi:DNA-binding transcriptional regulator YiaG